MIKSIDETINKNVKAFIEEIKRTSNNRRLLLPELDFEVFSEENDIFFRNQLYYYQIIKTNIRDILVIEMIKDFCAFYKIRCVCDHKKTFLYRTEGSVKRSFDRLNDYVFKIENTLYRFTGEYPGNNKTIEEDIKTIKSKHGVNEIFRLVFKKKTNQMLSCEITIEDFFEKYFPSGLYEKYLKAVIDVIKVAKEMIGYNTIRSFSSWKELEMFNEKLLNDLMTFDYESGYIFEDRNNSTILSKEDLNKIYNTFVEKEKCSLLLSETDFSKCFSTAEYLYSSIKNQNRFDYTAIVFDFFKAIELLVFFIVDNNKIDGEIDFYRFCNRPKKRDCEKCKFKKTCCIEDDRYYFSTKNKEEDCAKYRLEIVVDNLLLNKDLHNISSDGIKTIVNYLTDYRKTCRNGYIHKDTLFSLEEIERIRHNTWICAYALLGGFKTPNTNELSVYNYRYSSLYRLLKINGWTGGKFIIEKNGEEIKIVWDYQNWVANTEYDPITGTIANSLSFFVVDDFDCNPNDLDEESKRKLKVVTISPQNMPDSMDWVYKSAVSKGNLVRKRIFDKERSYLDYKTLFGPNVD